MEDLARLSFKRQPLYVGVDDAQDAATREGLEQGYCVVPSAQRFLLLFTFLKKNASKKAGRPPLDTGLRPRCPGSSCRELGLMCFQALLVELGRILCLGKHLLSDLKPGLRTFEMVLILGALRCR